MPNTYTRGTYLAVNPLYDVTSLQTVDVNSPEFKELLVRLFLTVGDIVTAVNLKDTGYYVTTEYNTSGQLFATDNNINNQRPIFRTVINCGALPAAGTKTIAHGITGITDTYSVLTIYGGATSLVAPSPLDIDFIPLPYVSASGVASNIEVSIDQTNVYITTGGTDYSAYTKSYIVFEYVQT